jgi:hypothetical protein
VHIDGAIVTNTLTAYYEDKGTRIEVIDPHRHNMARVIERANQTTRDRTATILRDRPYHCQQLEAMRLGNLVEIRGLG